MGQGREKERKNEGRTKERKNVEEEGRMKRGKQKFDSKEKENLNKRERDGKEINMEHEYIERKTKKRNKC